MRNKEYGIIINGCVYAAFSCSPAVVEQGRKA
nr:MAG TPA: hypothetical protein [Caudoviricetes sp.]